MNNWYISERAQINSSKRRNSLGPRVRGVEVREAKDVEGVRREHGLDLSSTVSEPVDLLLQLAIEQREDVHRAQCQERPRRQPAEAHVVAELRYQYACSTYGVK